MKIDGMNCFAAAVAAKSTELPYPRNHSTPEDRARYVAEVLEILYDGAKEEIRVSPIPYPTESKTPLLINIGESVKRVFWFHPWDSVSAFAEELAPLLSDAAACVL